MLIIYIEYTAYIIIKTGEIIYVEYVFKFPMGIQILKD